jgi:hypothetical protein
MKSFGEPVERSISHPLLSHHFFGTALDNLTFNEVEIHMNSENKASCNMSIYKIIE